MCTSSLQSASLPPTACYTSVLLGEQPASKIGGRSFDSSRSCLSPECAGFAREPTKLEDQVRLLAATLGLQYQRFYSDAFIQGSINDTGR